MSALEGNWRAQLKDQEGDSMQAQTYMKYETGRGTVAQVSPWPVELWDCKASSSNPLHVENTLDTTCTFNAPGRCQDRSGVWDGNLVADYDIPIHTQSL